MSTNTHLPVQAGPGEIPCPDPSAHPRKTQLQEQASRAALAGKGTQGRNDNWPFDEHGKLSSAATAKGLRYAKPNELPSFPTIGIDTGGSIYSVGSQAPSSNFSASAGKAALLANEYQVGPMWNREHSSAGSRKAALLAAKEGANLNLWTPQGTREGNSAAILAMRARGLSPELDLGYTADGRKKALLAATASMAKTKNHAGYQLASDSGLVPDDGNSFSSDANNFNSAAMQSARVRNIGKNMPREMFTERPPVAIEVEERRRNDALRASAVTMAKQMYAIQQKLASEAPADQGPQYVGLQAAAKKLADERLAKIDKDLEFHTTMDHYGYGRVAQSMKPTIGDRFKRWPQSPDDSDPEDEARARRIRRQMNNLNMGLVEADVSKRQKERDDVMAIAQRRVQARMHDMDEKVYTETGKVSQAKMEEWAKQARDKVAAESEGQTPTKGKVHIGGGKVLDQSELEAIALKRLQPLLDELTETAEKQRARDEELRLEREEKARQDAEQRMKDEANKAELRRVRNEENQIQAGQRAKEKDLARQLKASEKAKREAQRLVQKEEQARIKAEQARIREEEAKARREEQARIREEQARVREEQARVRAEEARVKAEEAKAKEEEQAKVREEQARVREEEASRAKEEQAKAKTTEAAIATEGDTAGSTVPAPATETREQPAIATIAVAEVSIGAVTSNLERGVSTADTQESQGALGSDVALVASRVLEAPVDAGPDHVSVHDHPDPEHLVSVVTVPASEALIKDSTAAEAATEALRSRTVAGGQESTTLAVPVTESRDTTAAETSTEAAASSSTATSPKSRTFSDSPKQLTKEPSAPKQRRESKIKGLFSKIRGGRDSRINNAKAAGEATAAAVGEDRVQNEKKAETFAAGGAALASGGATAAGAKVAHERGISPTAAVGTSAAHDNLYNDSGEHLDRGLLKGETSATVAAEHKEAAAASGVGVTEPKSKRRGSASSVSSLSSSGDEAGMAIRGRQGRKSVEDGDSEEEFEEARDTFDEGLSPQLQTREDGQSPARETRFSEDL